jgi:hypothetical protein
MTDQNRGDSPSTEVPAGVFYDTETSGPLQLELSRLGPKSYRMPRQFGYRDHRYDQPFLCPRDTDEYTTDLSSVPWFFSWIIPDLGRHFPAIMLHDALVVSEGGKKEHDGPDLDEPKRAEADRVMRDAMGELGVGFVRRWLAWTGAMLATAWSSLQPRGWWRFLVVATFGLIAVVGALASLDLFDVISVVPWMGDRSTVAELLFGGLFAVVGPLLLSVFWGRFWLVAAIGGVALALVLHITVGIFVAFSIYRLGERAAVSLGLTRDGSRSTAGLDVAP